MDALKLHIRDDQGRTTVVPVTRDQITVGRQKGSTIRLTERNVSRTHARILRRGAQLLVEDLSRYGTKVNGESLKQETKEVEDGDVIRIGDYELCLEAEQAARVSQKAPAEPAPPKPRPAKKLQPKPKGGAAGQTSMINLDEFQRRQREEVRTRVAAANPSLFIVTSELKGRQLELTGEELTIGRVEENDLRVDHRSVSAHHARLVLERGRYTIYDLDSANGLKINGDFYNQSVLGRGDVIELGHVKLRFLEAGEPFVFRPEEFEDEGEPQPKRSGAWKLLLLLALLGVAGGSVALLLLLSGEPEVTDSVPPKAEAAVTDKADNAQPPAPEPKAEPAPAKSVEAEPEPSKTTEPVKSEAPTPPVKPEVPGPVLPPTPEPVPVPPPAPPTPQVTPAQLFEQATTKLAAGELDAAETTAFKCLGQDSTFQPCKDVLGKVNAEKQLRTSAQAIGKLVRAQELEEAWKALQELGELPATSPSKASFEALRQTLLEQYPLQLVEQGKKLLKRKPKRALELAEEALAVDPEFGPAKKLKLQAMKRLNRNRVDRPDPPPTPSVSAGDLYKQARTKHAAGQLGEALKLYQQAAKKGHGRSWRQIGSIHMRRNNTSAACSAFRKYLRVRSDPTVKNILVRLGCP